VGDTSEVAQHCSLKERQSFKAEVAITNMKKLRYLDTLGITSFNATVTKITPFFVIFEIDDYCIEGKAHLSDMQSDYFIFEADSNALVGRRTKKKVCVNSRCSVLCDKIDYTTREAYYKIKGIH